MIRKAQSHGRIGEAAVSAKCWMHGIAAYNTGGLRANFAGSDLIIDTDDPRRKLLIQVKAGFNPRHDIVYLTQCTGAHELHEEKFVSDFVVFVNIDKKVGKAHQHEGLLDFQHLTYFVLSRVAANQIYSAAIRRDYERPLKTGGVRKLAGMAVNAPLEEMARFKDAWHLIKVACVA
ncbi:MAG: hypothetical protein LC130_28695 [Bryobacterales bacterium]|nr:hypothetical protein [Gammaproteobacteria bacterium]MCZ2078965.1 hypothetical protein [Bryobacterales bacterium]GIK36106.1 MAG: hypothetical protein BroJett010_26650 [Gammaproteobacteria bacterium]